MVATSDFSGLMSSDWALARALAIAPIDSLERCMIELRSYEVETDSTRFRPLGPHPMPDRLLGVLRHQCLQFGLGILVFEKSRTRAAENPCKFRPRVRRAHVDDAYGLNTNPRWLRQEHARRLTRFNTTPELFLSCEQEMLVERISRDGKLHPLAAPGDDRQCGRPCVGHPHVVLKLGNVLLGRCLL